MSAKTTKNTAVATSTYDATVESLKAEFDAKRELAKEEHKRELAKTDIAVKTMSMSERLAMEVYESQKILAEKKFALQTAKAQERKELAARNREEDRNLKTNGVLALGKEVAALKTDIGKAVADAVKADRAESDKKLDALIAAMTAMMAAKA